MRVLLVDDNICTQVAVGEFLKLLFKFEVVRAMNGQEALDKIAVEGSFDCIILDERMPVMDGMTFLQKYDGSIPIIYSSAYSEPPFRPVAAIYPKPYDSRLIGDEIVRICGEERAS